MLDSSWTRVGKDLYLGKGWVSHGYIHVKRKKEEDLTTTDRIVVDVRIGRRRPETPEIEDKDTTWEARPGGLWLLRSSQRHASDSDKAVTAIDILFGADAVDPRPGWTVKDQPLLINLDPKIPEPRLSVRHGHHKTPAKPQLRVRKDGKFKILQVSDMHLSTGLGACRDEYPPSRHCDADPRTLDFVTRVLDLEKPDLVVLSGDQVNGETAPDSQSAMFKMAEPFVTHNIPYALIFGNHDDEGSLSRAALMSLAETLPLSLSEAGTATVDGIGNYYVEVLARKTSHHSALTLYLLDTHSYSPDEARYRGYDWLKPSQLSWFKETATSLHASPAHKDYAHFHLDMAFIHIPLPEYREPDKLIADSGAWKESPTAPGLNSGFKDALVEQGIFAVSCGHDHANDYCSLAGHSSPENLQADLGDEAKSHAKAGKLWMCYAGGSGYGGYGGYGGYKRRVRVWEFDMTEGRVETWKRIDGEGEEGIRDRKRVVESGKVLDGRS